MSFQIFLLFRRDRYFPFKPVKVARDSNWLAGYDFLVIREGYCRSEERFNSVWQIASAEV